MKKNYFQLFLTCLTVTVSIVPLFMFSSCGSDDNPSSTEKAISNLFAGSDLVERKWESECKGSQFFGASSKRRYEFKGSGFEEIVLLHEDADCKTLSGTITYEGEYQVSSNQLNNETKDIKFEYSKVRATPHTQKAVDELNAIKLCEHTDWGLDKEIDLTNTSDNIICPVKKTPNIKYNLFIIDGNNLFLGKNDVDTEGERAIEVDRDNPYHKL
ncbi:MAG: hypothetical protein HQK50_15395 [Oligoflexia bacterium]|nr:hypothetical protein [Oligoflexia bacterium]